MNTKTNVKAGTNCCAGAHYGSVTLYMRKAS
jgi:hypothetical protein